MKRVHQNITINIGEDQTIIELSERIQSYNAEVTIRKVLQGNVHEINLKSLLGLFSVRLRNGDRITVECFGEEAEQALEAIVTYFS